MIRGVLKLCLGEASKSIYEALLAEITAPAPEKGIVELSLEASCLIIKIKSNKISGFRALLNSFILLIYASYTSILNAERIC